MSCKLCQRREKDQTRWHAVSKKLRKTTLQKFNRDRIDEIKTELQINESSPEKGYKFSTSMFAAS